MRILNVIASEDSSPTINSVMGFLYMWALSAVYWQRYMDGKTPLIPHSLRQYVIDGAGHQMEAFATEFHMDKAALKKYFKWIMQKAPDEGEELVGYMDASLKTVRGAMAKIRSNNKVSFDEIATLNALRSWHATQNENSLNIARKLLTRINMPKLLQQEFVQDVKSQAVYLKNLEHIVKQLTGTPGYTVPMEDAANIRETAPEALWKQYLDARKAADLIYKQELHNYMAQHGSPQPIQNVRKHLQQKGVKAHRLPPMGFEGQIDAEGHLYTSEGKKLAVNTLYPGATVVMNPDYDSAKDLEAGKNNNWYIKTILPTLNAKGGNNTQYIYVNDKRKVNQNAKFEVVQQMLQQEATIVGKWRKDLSSTDATICVPAAQCEISYLTAARIGGKDNENKQGKTYGLTTWLAGNVKKRGPSLIFDYVGKDSVQQQHTLSPDTPAIERVIKIVNTLLVDKKRSDPLWEYAGHEFNDSRLRAYFKTVCSVPGATIHKIRHLRGTRLMEEQLPGLTEKLLKSRTLSQAMVDSAVKSAAEAVGDLLGHRRGVGEAQKITPLTALKSYIDPSLLNDFYDSLQERNIRRPKWLVDLQK